MFIVLNQKENSISIQRVKSVNGAVQYLCHFTSGREHSGSVVECLTRDRGAAGSSLTGVNASWSLSKNIDPSLVLVQPRKTRPSITERLLMGRKESIKQTNFTSGREVIKLFSYSTQLSTKFILLIKVKMPTIVGILTFISMINITSERLKAINFFNCRYFSFYEQLKFCAQLS